jgi:hypothetical protein
MLNERRTKIVGFVKEKGEFELDFSLDIHFLVNALGEYRLLALHQFQGDYYLQREIRRQFQEEIERKRIKYQRKVQAHEDKLAKVKFEHRASHSGQDYPYGNFRFLPQGRLDKHGSLKLSGDFLFDFEGRGTVTETYERQPPSPEDESRKTRADLNKSFELPIQFNLMVELNKKPVSGNFAVQANVQNPFPQTEGDDASSVTFRDQLSLSGTYQLTPLFGKGK